MKLPAKTETDFFCQQRTQTERYKQKMSPLRLLYLPTFKAFAFIYAHVVVVLLCLTFRLRLYRKQKCSGTSTLKTYYLNFIARLFYAQTCLKYRKIKYWLTGAVEQWQSKLWVADTKVTEGNGAAMARQPFMSSGCRTAAAHACSWGFTSRQRTELIRSAACNVICWFGTLQLQLQKPQ